MSNRLWGDRAKSLAGIASIYGFVFFFGPVVWQLWMALRLGIVSLEESRLCLLSPYVICIAVLLFALDTASLARGMERIGAGCDVAVPRRMAIHCVSLLAFATIGTAVAMSMLPGADGVGASPPRMIIGSLNGASMCFVFYAASTAGVIARLAPPNRRSGQGEFRIIARTRAFNAWLFALGLPLFAATSLAAASLGIGASEPGSMLRLLASMAVPVTMGSALFIRADKRIASLPGFFGKEFAR